MLGVTGFIAAPARGDHDGDNIDNLHNKMTWRLGCVDGNGEVETMLILSNKVLRPHPDIIIV